MQPVTNSEGQKGFYSDATGFIPVDSMQKVTNESGQRGYYHAKAGFVPAPESASAVASDAQKEKGFLDSSVDDFRTRSKNVEKVINSSDALPSRVLQTIGQGAGFMGDVVANMIPDSVKSGMSGAVSSYLAENPGTRQGLQDIASGYSELESMMPETMRNVEAVTNIAGAVPIGKGMSAAGEAVGGVAKAGMKKTANVMYPKPTPKEALGQVLQGKTKDIPKGEKAFAVVDTKGVKTYAELGDRIDSTIVDYGRKVDDVLMRDKTAYPLDALKTVEKTAGGKAVEQNFVEKAITQLRELYDKTDDLAKAADMDDLLTKAQTSGLTKKEVNDIARVYGSEYRAFNPSSGEPLTSVNPQMYENVRKGLKEVARRGLDDTAKELDDTLSGLLNTRRLIEKNVEAANRLRQKVDERGLGEKIGRAALTAMDLATFGTVKGAVLKMFPRGLGYKTKNYIDLEDSLKRNLKIINDEYRRLTP